MTSFTSYFCPGCLCASVKRFTSHGKVSPLFETSFPHQNSHSAPRICTHKIHCRTYRAGRGHPEDIYMEVMLTNLSCCGGHQPWGTVGSGKGWEFTAFCFTYALSPSTFLLLSQIIPSSLLGTPDPLSMRQSLSASYRVPLEMECSWDFILVSATYSSTWKTHLTSLNIRFLFHKIRVIIGIVS